MIQRQAAELVVLRAEVARLRLLVAPPNEDLDTDKPGKARNQWDSCECGEGEIAFGKSGEDEWQRAEGDNAGR